MSLYALSSSHREKANTLQYLFIYFYFIHLFNITEKGPEGH